MGPRTKKLGRPNLFKSTEFAAIIGAAYYSVQNQHSQTLALLLSFASLLEGMKDGFALGPRVLCWGQERLCEQMRFKAIKMSVPIVAAWAFAIETTIFLPPPTRHPTNIQL